jgi:hypothetical protein
MPGRMGGRPIGCARLESVFCCAGNVRATVLDDPENVTLVYLVVRIAAVTGSHAQAATPDFIVIGVKKHQNGPTAAADSVIGARARL